MAEEDIVVHQTTSNSPGENTESAVLTSPPKAVQPPAILSHFKPHQPRSFAFPKRSFGKKTMVWRAFQPKWFDSHSWLHYDEAKDVAFSATSASRLQLKRN